MTRRGMPAAISKCARLTTDLRDPVQGQGVQALSTRHLTTEEETEEEAVRYRDDSKTWLSASTPVCLHTLPACLPTSVSGGGRSETKSGLLLGAGGGGAMALTRGRTGSMKALTGGGTSSFTPAPAQQQPGVAAHGVCLAIQGGLSLAGGV